MQAINLPFLTIDATQPETALSAVSTNVSESSDFGLHLIAATNSQATELNEFLNQQLLHQHTGNVALQTSANPLFSAVPIAASPLDKPPDGELTAQTIARLRLNAGAAGDGNALPTAGQILTATEVTSDKTGASPLTEGDKRAREPLPPGTLNHSIADSSKVNNTLLPSSSQIAIPQEVLDGRAFSSTPERAEQMTAHVSTNLRDALSTRASSQTQPTMQIPIDPATDAGNSKVELASVEVRGPAQRETATPPLLLELMNKSAARDGQALNGSMQRTSNEQAVFNNNYFTLQNQSTAPVINPSRQTALQLLKTGDQVDSSSNERSMIDSVLRTSGPESPLNTMQIPRTTAAPLTAAPEINVAPNNPAWATAFTERVKGILKADVRQAEIRLDPPHLGRIEVKIDIAAERTLISFTSEHGMVREAIDGASQRLRDHLADSGFNNVDVEVSHRDDRNSEQFAQSDAYQDLAPDDAEDSKGADGDDALLTLSSAGLVNRSGQSGIVNLYV